MNRTGCTWKGCLNKRVLTFNIEWRLRRNAIPGYNGLAGVKSTVAPCAEHLSECRAVVLGSEMQHVASIVAAELYQKGPGND